MAPGSSWTVTCTTCPWITFTTFFHGTDPRFLTDSLADPGTAARNSNRPELSVVAVKAVGFQPSLPSLKVTGSYPSEPSVTAAADTTFPSGSRTSPVTAPPGGPRLSVTTSVSPGFPRMRCRSVGLQTAWRAPMYEWRGALMIEKP